MFIEPVLIPPAPIGAGANVLISSGHLGKLDELASDCGIRGMLDTPSMDQWLTLLFWPITVLCE
jgi:hypothetical protein